MTALLREAAAAARSQPVTSILTAVMVAGMCVAALLTTGRTVGAEEAVLAQVDAAGTRSITVRADESAGLTADRVERLSTIEGVDQVTGFGPVVDARNAAVSGGTPVAVREAYGTVGNRVMRAPAQPVSAARTALASEASADTLGLADGTGTVTTDDGEELLVTGRIDVPEHLTELEPLVVVPSSLPGDGAAARSDATLTTLVVLARSPSEVTAVTEVVRSMVPRAEPGEVTVETSTALAEIRATVAGELGDHGRGTVLAILAVSAALLAVNLLALVTLRRKDFGRRRALGASRGTIVTLLLTQVTMLAAVGAATGVGAALAALAAAGDPLPDAEFTVAVVVASVLVATVAALGPAVMAAHRDPLHELRVP